MHLENYTLRAYERSYADIIKYLKQDNENQFNFIIE